MTDADRFEAVIVANGETPTGRALDVARSGSFVVACDGAFARAHALGLRCDLAVGDGDSIAPADLAELGARFVQVAEQDTNDLEKAFRELRRRRPDLSHVAIVGAGGGREDHLLDNVFRLVHLAEDAPHVALFTNHGRFDVVRDERTFACAPGDAVSVFAPTAGTRARSAGLVWPLDGVNLTPLWAGVHNRTAAGTFTLAADHPLLVYREFGGPAGT